MIRAGLLASAMIALLAPVTPANAQGSDCEKIKDAHAYNNCLASAGPASRAAAGTRARGSSAYSRRAAPAQPVARGGVTVRRLPSGRMRMEIPARRR